MLISIGHFLFRFRNAMFPVACLPLLLPGPEAFDNTLVAAAIGALVALLGQVIRVLTIGLRYIIRGGRNRRVYAEGLVTDGLYAHTRNPMYIGNLLIVSGVAIASNCWTTIGIGLALGSFLYICIVAAEEQYLLGRFGTAYREYCSRTPRWFPRLSGLGRTLSMTRFHWRRVLVKEYGTPFGWIMIILAVTLFNLHARGIWSQRHGEISTIATIAAITVMLWFIAWRLKRSRTVIAD